MTGKPSKINYYSMKKRDAKILFLRWLPHNSSKQCSSLELRSRFGKKESAPFFRDRNRAVSRRAGSRGSRVLEKRL